MPASVFDEDRDPLTWMKLSALVSNVLFLGSILIGLGLLFLSPKASEGQFFSEGQGIGVLLLMYLAPFFAAFTLVINYLYLRLSSPRMPLRLLCIFSSLVCFVMLAYMILMFME